MFKFVAIFAIIVVASEARNLVRLPRATATGDIIAVLKSESDFHPDGSFTYSFEGADGSSREETGVLMNAGKEDAFVAVTGSYKYTDVEGQTVEVHYTADDHGFVPTGTNIHNSITAAAKAAGIAH